METLLAFMNHFPLFALMQKVKDPWRIPGICFSQLLASFKLTNVLRRPFLCFLCYHSCGPCSNHQGSFVNITFAINSHMQFRINLCPFHPSSRNTVGLLKASPGSSTLIIIHSPPLVSSFLALQPCPPIALYVIGGVPRRDSSVSYPFSKGC